MYTVTVRFYEELNFFLPREHHKQDIVVSCAGRRSVKDLIESLGVPHPEVDLILVNGTSVSFEHLLTDGDRISVYPVFERFDISGVTRLRPAPLRITRFVADVHLGTLARRLRILGFDTLYDPSLTDPELADLSNQRVLLTRDTRLLMRSVVSRGLYVRNTDPKKQVAEVMERLDLASSVQPFTRCAVCNGLIALITEQDDLFTSVLGSVPANVGSWCREFGACDTCGKIYWKGSHYTKLVAELADYLPDSG